MAEGENTNAAVSSAGDSKASDTVKVEGVKTKGAEKAQKGGSQNDYYGDKSREMEQKKQQDEQDVYNQEKVKSQEAYKRKENVERRLAREFNTRVEKFTSDDYKNLPEGLEDLTKSKNYIKRLEDAVHYDEVDARDYFQEAAIQYLQEDPRYSEWGDERSKSKVKAYNKWSKDEKFMRRSEVYEAVERFSDWVKAVRAAEASQEKTKQAASGFSAYQQQVQESAQSMLNIK